MNCCATNVLQKTLQNDSTGQNVNQNIHNIVLANNAILYQNTPNPFADGTTIKYFIPSKINAEIIFYDEYGSQLKVFRIAENGMGQLNITATNLAPGMYSYSLLGKSEKSLIPRK